MADETGALFAAHERRLFKYFCRAVGDMETARDLTQDVFVRVSRAAIPADSDGEVRSWLFTIARNLAIDHHREHLRRPAPSELMDEAARSPSQDVDLAVNEALATLGDLDREIQVKPAETVEIRLPMLGDDAGPFAKRAFSIRIRARQIR